MAGPAPDLEDAARRSREIGPYAGNGREDIVDGPLLPTQPYDAGFCVVRPAQRLVVRRQSALRGRQRRQLDPRGAVRSQRQRDDGGRHGRSSRGRLFTFGDVGRPRPARCGCSTRSASLYHDGKLYVADTYNNKIKVIDLAKRERETLAGTGNRARRREDEPATFDEPAGLSLCGRQAVRGRHEQPCHPHDRPGQMAERSARSPFPASLPRGCKINWLPVFDTTTIAVGTKASGKYDFGNANQFAGTGSVATGEFSSGTDGFIENRWLSASEARLAESSPEPCRLFDQSAINFFSNSLVCRCRSSCHLARESWS